MTGTGFGLSAPATQRHFRPGGRGEGLCSVEVPGKRREWKDPARPSDDDCHTCLHAHAHLTHSEHLDRFSQELSHLPLFVARRSHLIFCRSCLRSCGAAFPRPWLFVQSPFCCFSKPFEWSFAVEFWRSFGGVLVVCGLVGGDGGKEGRGGWRGMKGCDCGCC